MTKQSHNDEFSRRRVLRTGAVAGVLVSGAAVGGAVAQSQSQSEKQGGRAELEGEVRRNTPFELEPDPTETPRGATCMATESADQTYLAYSIQYCGSDDDSDGTLYVIPDEAELVPDEVYEIRSTTPCRTSDLTKVAFGPSQQSC